MRKKENAILRLMAAVLALLTLSAFLTYQSAARTQNEYYEIQVEAARRLEQYFAAVRGYREELGIPLSDDDLHKTGMIGLPYTGITTTSGALEAKRTAAWPDMAALCVRMLYEAGVRPGDTVGAGFSGSFPGMNLAVVAACESMNVKLVCICSVGASTYGANIPELTFPDMMYRLKQGGLIRTQSAAVTMGGYHDVGADMDTELAGQIRRRLTDLGLNLLEEADFQANLELRETLYLQEGPIDCFVAVGGNLTSLGQGETGVSLGQGVLRPERPLQINEASGLVQRYLARGLPVINLLNIKKIMADYSMPYDPAQWPPIGQSAVYSSIRYERGWILLGLGGTAVLLSLCLWIRRRGKYCTGVFKKDANAKREG
ncbi:MAG: poly-gamma-glutamate system protein [Oscillospiraceae bacterium]|nr:poly-gamma-glutamate system protein [Oscillospiraceae bacterium]